MENKKAKLVILHICDYAAQYRGNFIDSLESIETYHNNITNLYLFPNRAKGTATEKWIDQMNMRQTVAYIQENSILKNFILLKKIIKKHKVDRVVRHFSDFRIDIALKFLFEGKNVIRFFHCGYSCSNKSLKHKARRFFWKKNKLVGVSDSVSRDIKCAFPDFFVTSIVNAVHFERLDNKDPFTKSKGVSLLMMGWDYERKGVDLAVKVAAKLQKKYNISLQIVGGVNEDKIDKIVTQILGKNKEWVSFLPPTNNIGTYYAASDIFLSPSRQEAFGYANVEAAYCNNSVVLSVVDGQGEIQIEGAYWFESENLEDFEKKLEKAILDLQTPEKKEQKERVKAALTQIYSLETWTNKVVELF